MLYTTKMSGSQSSSVWSLTSHPSI